MKRLFLICSSCIVLLSCCVAQIASAANRAWKITYLSPDGEENQFVKPTAEFMRAAAKDLGIELEIIAAHNNHNMMRHLLEKTLSSSRPPDLVITVSFKDSGLDLLQICEKAKVPILIENEAIPDPAAGAPRQNYKYYIGEITPAEEMAGYHLAQALFHIAKPAKDGKVHVLAFNGDTLASAAVGREQGLMRAIAESKDVQMGRVMGARWSAQSAKSMFLGYHELYKDVNVVWSASDSMALGVISAADQLHLVHGKDYVIGSIDWSQEGIAALRQGKLDATAGGHFMEAAWALIVAFDYLQGIDFEKSEGLRIKTEMAVLTKENLAEYEPLLDRTKWSKINFKKLSKFYNRKRSKYDFSLKSILK